MELDDVAPPKRSLESIDSLHPGQVTAATTDCQSLCRRPPHPLVIIRLA